MTIEEKLTLWKLANDARREAGKGEILFADFRDFLEQFRRLSVDFDAWLSDAIAAQQSNAG